MENDTIPFSVLVLWLNDMAINRPLTKMSWNAKNASACLGLMLARIDVVIAWQFLMFGFGDWFMARLTFHEYQVVLFIDTFKRKWMQNMNIGRIFFLSVKRDRKHSYLMYVSWIYIPRNRTLLFCQNFNKTNLYIF